MGSLLALKSQTHYPRHLYNDHEVLTLGKQDNLELFGEEFVNYKDLKCRYLHIRNCRHLVLFNIDADRVLIEGSHGIIFLMSNININVVVKESANEISFVESHIALGTDVAGYEVFTEAVRDLSGTIIKSNICIYPHEWIRRNGIPHEEGYIFFKKFGFLIAPPTHWVIEEGSVIEENVDLNRRYQCSYGINIATYNWFDFHRSPDGFWKVLVKFEDLNSVCVPYLTDTSGGKIRAGRIHLLERAK